MKKSLIPKQAVILAAGKSSRFWPLNQSHKSLIKIMGRPLVWYTLCGLKESGVREAVLVDDSRKSAENELKKHSLPGISLKFARQNSPKGMGNALWQARKFLKGSFLVLNAERVDIAEVLKKAEIAEDKGSGWLFGAETEKPELFGIARMQGKRVLEIEEKPKSPSSNIRIVGLYLLKPDFFQTYRKTKKGPYDFEKALSRHLKEKNLQISVLKGLDLPYLKHPWDLFSVQKYLFSKKLKRSIDKSAKIGKGAVIEGRVFLGKNSFIMEGAVVKGPCYIGENCLVGTNSLVRESNLEKDCLVGSLGEVARCLFQENAHIHSGFFGDSVLGSGSRIGAGTVTGNVRLDRKEIKSGKKGTGLKSLGIIAGPKVKIGINCSLMPGILIGAGSVIGPASVVFKNLKENSVFFKK